MPEITPVALIRTPYSSKFGIPRQSGTQETEGRIELNPPYRSPDAVRGLEGFSHLWLIWGFHEAKYNGASLTVCGEWDGWYSVNFNGIRGYASARYIRL